MFKSPAKAVAKLLQKSLINNKFDNRLDPKASGHLAKICL